MGILELINLETLDIPLKISQIINLNVGPIIADDD
jgi:hypothetical protein